MSGLATVEQKCECGVCTQKKSLIEWLDNESISYKLSKNGWPITSETTRNSYRREFFIGLVEALARQQARVDYDKEQ